MRTQVAFFALFGLLLLVGGIARHDWIYGATGAGFALLAVATAVPHTRRYVTWRR
ncbi:MAG: hypothetical protein J2P17_18040 [Mycobacterium sp.]|nr:hypothetical protein [Mycobacterium sp.]